jgi:hypothetical protein
MSPIRQLQSSIVSAFMALTAIFFIGLVPATPAQAETFNTCAGFITSLPFTITTQGIWCLNADLTTAITSGSAITVAANNVTIDCNDFKLGGLAAGAGTTTFGIFADSRDNLNIRRCNIRGFLIGAYLLNGSGHLIEDNRFDSNTFVGIDVTSNRSIIRRNLIIATGGSSVSATPSGIYSSGSVDIIDNIVNGVMANGTNTNAYGIQTSANPDGSISGNRVRGLVKTGTASAYGILNFTSGRITLRNNDVVGDGSAGSIGLLCASAQGRATWNVVGGFATNISTCSGTNNEIVP